MEIILASRNQKKIKELNAILSASIPDIRILSLDDIGFAGDIEEDGTTFEENAIIKARAAMEASGLPAIADDSGIAVRPSSMQVLRSRITNAADCIAATNAAATVPSPAPWSTLASSMAYFAAKVGQPGAMHAQTSVRIHAPLEFFQEF